MSRLAAIEGLRAWLAWAVVLSHVGQTVGLEMHGGHWVWFARMGETGVFTFIAISGFVIAGLVLDKRESWPRYIIRRAFRIFPAYWIAYAFALAVFPFAIGAAAMMPWAHDPAFNYDDLLAGWSGAMHDRPWAETLLHAALLQGVVPDSVWPFAGTAVLGPAWSLTLEWQFYLIAPALVWLLASRRWRLLTTLTVFAAALAFRADLFGHFMMPNFLPGAAFIFMIGIASRLAFAQLSRIEVAPAFVVAALGFGVLFPALLWLATWVGLIAFIANDARWRATANSPLVTAMNVALTSRTAGYLGARSYAVYLIHLPTMQLLTWVIVSNVTLTQLQLSFVVLVATVPVVLLVSDIIHRVVERPMIKLGASLAARIGERPHSAPAAP